MYLLVLVLICVALTTPGQAQTASAGPEMVGTLNFETEHTGSTPRGWGGGPPGTIFLDGQIVHGGKWSARLERVPTSANPFSTMTRAIPIDFAGARLELRGFLRSEGVAEWLGLWMREDGDVPALAFDNMQQRQVRGTTDWTEYSIALPVHPNAKQLFFGVLLAGPGKVWVDDLQLLVDGKPVWEAPKGEKPTTALDLDRQFDPGSGIVIDDLTKIQIENLATLGKVWGFLKYHHQSVIAGRYHWDYELFRVLPGILAATDRATSNAALVEWVRRLGNTTACRACIALAGSDIHLRPDVDWIDQPGVVGRDLAEMLRAIHRDRPGGKQFYVSQSAGVGNPVFDHELPYTPLRFPDAGYQLLALYRFWNIVQYWSPYRDLLDRNWDDVLAEFIPRIVRARDKDQYQLEMIALIATVTDTHANLLNAPTTIRPPAGGCQLPVILRFIENRATVTGYSEATVGPATGLHIGDVITSLDEVPVSDLIERWKPYYPASNEPTRLRDIARAMTRGACGIARLSVSRPGGTVQITAQRLAIARLDQRAGQTHDLPGETFRLLSDRVAYLKLSSVQSGQTASYIEGAKGTTGLIIDIRNYPSDFVVFALGSLLVDRSTPFARFTTGDLDNPGAFHWAEPLSLESRQPHYPGKVAVLVDEVSISQAEYTAMALRSAPQAIVVGSTTAGADGNVSAIPLPGGLQTMISGIGVFYPNKAPTQRVGIVPDVEVRPTIAGIRAGRDEVLEEALRQILGRNTPADQIETMARH